MQHSDANVAISLGENCDFAIVEGQLFCTQYHNSGRVKQVIPLGIATKARFDDLKHYLDRLSVHAVDA